MKRTVFTNGCFDTFHDGHRYLLQSLAKLSTHLIVAMNSDSSIKRLKGSARPIDCMFTRVYNVCEFLEGINASYTVLAFSEDTPERLIKAIKPSAIAKGSDAQRPLPAEDFVLGYGGQVWILDRLPGISTTELLSLQ